jgi:hypothetical protein
LVFYDTPHRKLWIPPDVETPEVARQLITTPKLMITIPWAVSGIHAIDYFLQVFYSIPRILVITLMWLQHSPNYQCGNETKKFMIHLDNSSIYKSKASVQKSRVCRYSLRLIRHTP